jgi:hypothetical protein
MLRKDSLFLVCMFELKMICESGLQGLLGCIVKSGPNAWDVAIRDTRSTCRFDEIDLSGMAAGKTRDARDDGVDIVTFKDLNKGILIGVIDLQYRNTEVLFERWIDLHKVGTSSIYHVKRYSPGE